MQSSTIHIANFRVVFGCVVIDNSSSPSDFKSQFVLGIPTRNRPEILKTTLFSISKMKCLPVVVVVCDSSDDRNHEHVLNICKNSIMPTVLIRSAKASIPYQRNRIVEYSLKSEIDFDFLLFLDDDTEPEFRYSHILLDFLQNNSTYGGASGVTQDQKRSRIADWLGSLFLVNGKPGQVLYSGIGVPPNRNLNEGSDTKWIFGCSMWRRSVLTENKWNESWEGYAAGEDVLFSFSVSKNWKLRVLPTAKIENSYASEGRPSSLELTRMMVNHRWEIAQLHKINSGILLLCVTWSVIGEIGFCLFKAIARFDIDQRKNIKGYLHGLFDILQLRATK